MGFSWGLRGYLVGVGLPPWPKFETRARPYLEIATTGAAAKEGLRRPFCDVFLENVRRINGR